MACSRSTVLADERGSRRLGDVLADNAAEDATGRRLIAQLAACEVAALAFCRLLERWARGDADPCTPGKRQAALRRAAERAETALSGLERPLGRYLLELEPDDRRGPLVVRRARRGRAARLGGRARPRRRVACRPVRVAQAYLELAVLVRALEGLRAAADLGSEPDRSSLWAGLFDLRENLLGRTLDDLRALAA